jgi:hypothetical protein
MPQNKANRAYSAKEPLSAQLQPSKLSDLSMQHMACAHDLGKRRLSRARTRGRSEATISISHSADISRKAGNPLDLRESDRTPAALAHAIGLGFALTETFVQKRMTPCRRSLYKTARGNGT